MYAELAFDSDDLTGIDSLGGEQPASCYAISTATSSVSSDSSGIPVLSLPSMTTVRPCAARRSALIWESGGD